MASPIPNIQLNGDRASFTFTFNENRGFEHVLCRHGFTIDLLLPYFFKGVVVGRYRSQASPVLGSYSTQEHPGLYRASLKPLKTVSTSLLSSKTIRWAQA